MNTSDRIHRLATRGRFGAALAREMAATIDRAEEVRRFIKDKWNPLREYPVSADLYDLKEHAEKLVKGLQKYQEFMQMWDEEPPLLASDKTANQWSTSLRRALAGLDAIETFVNEVQDAANDTAAMLGDSPGQQVARELADHTRDFLFEDLERVKDRLEEFADRAKELE